MSAWIVCDPEILGGKPCIRDTRISVEHLLECLASGRTQAEFLEAYPHVPRKGVAAALRYAAGALRSVQDEKIAAALKPLAGVLRGDDSDWPYL